MPGHQWGAALGAHVMPVSVPRLRAVPGSVLPSQGTEKLKTQQLSIYQGSILIGKQGMKQK